MRSVGAGGGILQHGCVAYNVNMLGRFVNRGGRRGCIANKRLSRLVAARSGRALEEYVEGQDEVQL